MSDKNAKDVIALKEKLVYFLMGINAGMLIIIIYQNLLGIMR